MSQSEDTCHRRPQGFVVPVVAVAAILIATSGCRQAGRSSDSPAPAVLRMGVAQASPTDPIRGLRQLNMILSVESLLRPSEDGRLQPLLADRWKLAGDGSSVSLHLRPGVKFHDGTPLDVGSAVAMLPDALREFMGPVFADIENIKASDDSTVEIRFRKPSPFLLETLEAPIRKPGKTIIGTGPYATAQDSATALRSNNDYYLGRPVIDRLVVSNYPSVRSAWAEMLRNRLDMLYEVGSEALGSMEASTTISTFTYTRHYQYVVALNTKSPALRSREVRRALNWAIDRNSIVQDALNGHGVASSQPLSSQYWAIERHAPQFGHDPDRAIRAFEKPLHFTCLVPPDAVSERIGLQLKRQLQSVGVDMALEDATQERIVRLTTERRYEAALVEFISGPTLFRPYLVWHSDTPLNTGVGNESMDAALDRVRHAPSEREYRTAVAGLLQAFMDDPPAIFLAWSVRARAISKRFAVEAEEGRDVLSTLRLWKPTTGRQQASRN